MEVNWYILATFGALVLATYLAAMVLALQWVRRASLLRHGELTGRMEAAAWIATHREPVMLVAALLRTLARLAVFMLVLVIVVDLSEEVTLTGMDLLISFVISAVLLWTTSTVLATAIANHAGNGLIFRSVALLKVFRWAGAPLKRSFRVVDEAVRRLAGAAGHNETEAEEELLRSIEETQREGALDEDAAEMLENVVEFTSTEVSEIMTPRTDIEGVELSDDLARIRAFFVNAGHSRIPVYRENLDQIVGILYVKDLIRFVGTSGEGFRLEPILRQPIRVPESKPVRELLSDFQRSEVHLAIVVDEYGGTSGLVTIEDVLEEIVGEIHDEHEPADEELPALVAIEDGRVEVDGRYYIDDLNERLGLDLPEDEDFDTLGGFVLAVLGRVPQAGESFETHGVRFTTIDVTPTQVVKVRVESSSRPVGVESAPRASTAD